MSVLNLDNAEIVYLNVSEMNLTHLSVVSNKLCRSALGCLFFHTPLYNVCYIQLASVEQADKKMLISRQLKSFYYSGCKKKKFLSISDVKNIHKYFSKPQCALSIFAFNGRQMVKCLPLVASHSI